MSSNDLWNKYLKMRKNPDPHIDSLICQLLEHRAIIKDKEINNRLLQELITKYSESESRLKQLNRELIKKQDRIELDLLAAAEIQKSLLPRDSVGSDVMNVAWKFRPCEEIGGDIFNVIPLNEDHWAFYMIDVAGHGVQAAMIAVTVYQYLQSNNGILLSQTTKSVPTLKIYRPAEVLAFLDREYPFERFSSFFTMNYVVVNTAQGTLAASSAGHPPPVILRKNGKLILLKRGGRPIGTIDMRLSEDEPIVFPEEHHRIRAGDKLIFYTDGVTDYQNEQGQLYGAERFYEKLIELKDLPLSELIEKSFNSLFEFGQNEDPKDDISLLGLELQKQNA